MKKTLIIAGVVAALPFSAALASVVTQPPFTRADVAEFHGNDRSVIDAMKVIQQDTGGRVLEVRFSTMNGAPGYQAVVAKGDDLSFVRLDEGATHTVVLNQRPDWMMGYDGKLDAHLAERARVPLAEAIRTAEQAAQAPAVAAGLARSAHSAEVKTYNILVDENGSVRRIAIDDKTGQVIANPELLSG